jgi:hypothetical protein
VQLGIMKDKAVAPQNRRKNMSIKVRKNREINNARY